MKYIKFEMDENTMWATIWTTIALSLTGIIITGMCLFSWSTRTALKAGLVEKQAIGQSYTIWSKP